MARFERIKTLFDVVQNPSRYRNPEEEVNLDEKTSVTEWRDESSPTLTERLASRKTQFYAFGFFILVGFGVVGAWSRTYIPELYGNPFIKGGTLVFVSAVIAYFSGLRSLRAKLSQIDWLVLFMPREEAKSGLSFYVGSVDGDAQGNTTFQPLKGFSFAGLKGEKLTLGELGDDFGRTFSKAGQPADRPATIRVQDGLFSRRETFLGTVVGVMCGGVEIDGFAGESDLYTTPPETVDPDRYKGLKGTMMEVVTEKQELEERNETLAEQRDYWKAEAKQTREEIISEFVSDHSELAESGFGPSRRRRDERSSPRVGMNDYSFLNEGDE